jgi:hypothetical protein
MTQSCDMNSSSQFDSSASLCHIHTRCYELVTLTRRDRVRLPQVVTSCNPITYTRFLFFLSSKSSTLIAWIKITQWILLMTHSRGIVEQTVTSSLFLI